MECAVKAITLVMDLHDWDVKIQMVRKGKVT